MKNEEIYQYLLSRGVKKLLHFTSAENINSILELGLVSKLELEKENIEYDFNDTKRLENKENSISLSVDFPNYEMFFKYRQDKDMVVLEIDLKVLLRKNCVFYSNNAARNELRYIDIKELSNIDSVEKMFASTVFGIERSKDIPENYTTCPQAEILCLENIEPDYIKAIYFEDLEELGRLSDEYDIPQKFNYKKIRKLYTPYYRPRKDWELWFT